MLGRGKVGDAVGYPEKYVSGESNVEGEVNMCEPIPRLRNLASPESDIRGTNDFAKRTHLELSLGCNMQG